MHEDHCLRLYVLLVSPRTVTVSTNFHYSRLFSTFTITCLDSEILITHPYDREKSKKVKKMQNKIWLNMNALHVNCKFSSLAANSRHWM